ncbi:MAG: prepilin-type N-terminal cleavage/methylation domain-containing protein [Burkholderiales bacterium]|nr:prepilin-type N-terminal cleavage/methylation domain-containing protein [Burkholderiales bacterium]
MSKQYHHDVKRIRGFTIIEISIALAILGILLMIGVPALMSSLSHARINAVPEFYLDGLRKAQGGARKYNVASRFVLTPHANGQYNWQVDFCAPINTTPCNDTSGAWSTPATSIMTNSNPPQPVLSIQGSADNLPSSSAMVPTLSGGNNDVYFTAMGWLNTNVGNNLTWIRFDPNLANGPSDIPSVQVSITLAGGIERCYPNIADPTDSRSCP